MILDIQIDVYKFPEAKSAFENLKAMRNVLGKVKKKIIIFDRGYPSIKLILNLIDHKEKFLFRLKSNDFKREQKSMKSNDEWIDIKYDRVRTNQFRSDFYLVERLLKLKKINLRFVRIPITTSNGELVDEYLLTNLDNEEFDVEGLKKLYHLRWNIETSYRVLKSNLKLEDFTGLKPTIIVQDIYISVFVFNLVQDIISNTNEQYKMQEDKYKYKMKVNSNFAIGIIKNLFIKILIEKSKKKSDTMIDILYKKISENLIPIRDDRSYPRDITPVNKCRMSYKYSY